ncbi:MAG: hypothetical protein WA655_19245 [Candidatus Korobacteraceae bacterium]
MKGCRAGIFLLLVGSVVGLVFVSTSLAQNPSDAQRLYGSWYTYPLGNPNTDPIRHEFRHNPSTGKDEMVVTRICQGDNTALIAKAITPIEITQDSIRILKSVSRSEGQGSSECKVSVDAGTLGYVLSAKGDRISITNPGGVPDMFELAREEQAKNELIPASVYGTWLLPIQQQHGATIQIKLIFYDTASENRGKLREISVCSKQNDSLTSQVDAHVRISKNEITILEGVSHEENSGPFTCQASITPGTLHYVLAPTGGTMVLTKPSQPPLTLTREQ